MYDPDVIAYLFPPEGQGRRRAMEAINMDANRSRFLPPRRTNEMIKPAPKLQSRWVREAIEQPEEVDDLELLPCQVLRFSNPPKTRLGLVAGRSPQADLVLPKLPGVSWYHFALTFDEEMCLVVKDLDSTIGTRVIYDGEERQRGHGITWSACGPSFLSDKMPVIKVVGELQFRLVVVDHDVTSQTYRDKVVRFLNRAAPAEDIFLDMKITSRTRTQNPGQIFWKRELGRGGFAVVNYLWDVTTRAEYALKEPLPGAGGDWKREVKIMKGISHDNIVALRHASFDPSPQLYFEYVPGGSLDNYPSTTSVQREQITIQLLDGLTYLHDEKLIAHRDIKPANVLVQDWSPHRVHVKLADFGLSKQSDDLITFCGTAKYLAPEVFCARLARRRNSARYDTLVDIWSLAVLLVSLECGQLPRYLKHYENSGAAWGDVMVEFVRNHQRRHGTSDLLSFVLEDMLVVDPENRLPAKKCLEKALRLFGGGTSDDGEGSGEDSGEDSGEESNPSTPRDIPTDVTSSLNNRGVNEAPTIHLCPRDCENNGQSPELSELRAPAPGSINPVVGLGEKGSGFIEALPKMGPSDVSELGRSDAPSPDTVRQNSVVGNELWDVGATTGARDSVAGLEEGEDEGGQRGGTGSDLVGPGLRAAIIRSRLANATREEDGPDAIAVGSPSRRKRPRPDEDLDSRAVQFSSELTDQEPEDGNRKRRRVWIGETQA